MKKLIIAAFAVVSAIAVQAGTIKWDNGFGINAYNQPGDEGNAYVGNIYLMVGGTDTATTFINTVLGAEADYAAKFDELVGSSIASINHADFEPDISDVSTTLVGDYSFFVVALDAANQGVYMSELADASLLAVGSAPLAFSHDAAYENSAFGTEITTYQGAGWYTAVPEPTSGLLLLLGMAGLALKRKVA